ncbi:uncharacterized protein LOC128991928 [Macrosteles quadrilineatus]|uniref:uncharacterized protein LOC128991928 n=1 Tax=Macrosteles quadrilineatus TaxID=74068 RepID=UPI0023E21F79|nr:uncharacterized protein LOC128991928 [Macrosteles quadrilineatus]
MSYQRNNTNNAYQGYVDPWVHGSSSEQVNHGRAFLQSRTRVNRGNRFQSRGRRNFQARSVEAHRESVGMDNSESFEKAIRGKLLAGLKDEATGVATKKAALTETAVPLQISTRQIGFGLTNMLNTANVDQKLSQMANANRGTINQYYRIGLSLIETKLFKTSTRISEAIDEIEELPKLKRDTEFQNISTTAVRVPEPIATFVNSIGLFKDTTESCFTSMPVDHISETGEFVPLPENLRISNLRQTVVALSNPATQEATRTYFEEHNPIPGTIWANHLLLNPDDIIGEKYGATELEDDLNAIGPHAQRLFEKYPKCLGRINWEKYNVGKEIFVSCDIAEMHVMPRRENEEESAYTTRNHVHGDHKVFKMRFPMKEAELRKGINLLMGEVTSVRTRRILYTPRIPRYLRYKSTMVNYKSVINMRFKVTFIKANGDRVTSKGKEGDSLLDVVVNNNLDFDGFGACEGTLTCSTCHCIFKQEDYDRLPEKPCDEELDMLDLAYDLTPTSRLGCQILLSKDLDGVEVRIPATVNDARS